MSATTVSNGSAITSATIRGMIRTSSGSSAITRRASISSRMAIEPISAVMAEPVRPAIMMAVISSASSRRPSTPTRLTA